MSALQRRATGLFAMIMAAGFLAACAAPAPVISTTVPKTQAQSAPMQAAAPVALRVPGLRELTGLHQPDILAMLGKPDLKRDEPPAQLWQYRAADCVLNLFFYREQDGYRLVHAEAWQRSLGGSASAAQCRDENAPVRAHLVSLQSSL
jgi:hypothetical protein